MPRLDWGAIGERFYDQGVDRGVLYVNGQGFAWPGLVSVSESPSGGQEKSYYIDGYKYASTTSSEEFGAVIEAYSSPAEFAQCEGDTIVNGLIATQQPRKPFGLCYRSGVGNDTDGTYHAYKIHLIYNALAAPSNRKHSTIGKNSTPDTRSWTITTRPPNASNIRPTAHFVIDSRLTEPTLLASVEDVLYGSADNWPSLPTVPALFDIFGGLEYDAGNIDSDFSNTLDGGRP
jgi:hypothetical protein